MQGPLHSLKAQSTFAINVLNRVGLSDCFDCCRPERRSQAFKASVKFPAGNMTTTGGTQISFPCLVPILRGRVYTRPAGSSRFSSLTLGSPEKRTRHLISTSSISNSNLPGSCACANAIPRKSLPSVLNADHGNEYCFQSGPTVNGTIAGI